MPITPEQSAVLSRVATQVARSYHRTHPWISVEEIQSEAWVAMLEALPKFNPDAGDMGGYLYRCASREAKKLCWRLSVAANVPERSATPKLVSTLRQATTGEVALMAVAAEDERADERLNSLRSREALAQIVAEYLAAGQEGEAVRAVLYGEAKSAEAAATYNVPLQTIYQTTFRVRRALAADPRVQELL